MISPPAAHRNSPRPSAVRRPNPRSSVSYQQTRPHRAIRQYRNQAFQEGVSCPAPFRAKNGKAFAGHDIEATGASTCALAVMLIQTFDAKPHDLAPRLNVDDAPYRPLRSPSILRTRVPSCRTVTRSRYARRNPCHARPRRLGAVGALHAAHQRKPCVGLLVGGGPRHWLVQHQHGPDSTPEPSDFEHCFCPMREFDADGRRDRDSPTASRNIGHRESKRVLSTAAVASRHARRI